MNKVCREIDSNFTLTRVNRIRLRPVRDMDVRYRNDVQYFFEFVQIREDGLPHWVSAPAQFWIQEFLMPDETGEKDEIVRRLVDVLRLQHLVVDGVDELIVV